MRFAVALALVVLLASAALAHEPRRPAAEMAAAARGFLDRLPPDKRRAASFGFDDAERFDWHYTPRRRDGLAFRDMSGPERAVARDLMAATLSAAGLRKTEAIMALEAVLAELEGSGTGFRVPENYPVRVFGTPGPHPWGWRLEGHHVSLNVTVATPDEVAIVPAFLGSNPARIPTGPQAGTRIQDVEYHLGLELARSLSDEQWSRALLRNRTFGDILTGPGRAQALATPAGLPWHELTAAQQDRLVRLVEEYVGLARDEIGRPYMERVRAAGLETLHFAWAGGRGEGDRFYYRIHGPRLLIELDNTQNDGNHVHALWRDPQDDFGRDMLRRHYEHGHHAVPPDR